MHNRIYYVSNPLGETANYRIADELGQEKFGEHHQIAAKTLPNNGLLNMYASSSRGATGSRHSALQTGGLGPTGRKRPREALRDFPIPTSAAFFGAVAPTWKIDSTPKRLHYLDNEGKITSRLFSPARKLDYSKRRRLSRTPSPASSSHGEMDPDSPTFLKMKRIEARHAQLHEANIPRPVPAQADHGDLFQKPRQPPQPVYSSRYSYKTPNPMPNETKDDADMPGLTGIIHFSAPGRNASVEFSDDEGILYFKPWDVEDEVMAGEETGSYDNPVVVEDETASEGEDEEDGYSFGPMLYMGTEV